MSVALKSHFFLKLSNKMRKRRKQSIFDFNHIDPHIQEEELEEIKNLFPILSQKILVPETSAWTIQENESAHKFDLFPVWLQSEQLLEA